MRGSTIAKILFFFLFFTFNLSKAQEEMQIIDEDFEDEEIIEEESTLQNQNLHLKTPTESKHQSSDCIFYNNATFQVTNKMEGRTYNYKVSLNEPLKIDFLEVKLVKCCKTDAQHNYAFVKVQNTKMQKEVFSGWMFSHAPSVNPFEDARFDLILLQCF